jgi:signal peptidase I
MSRPQSKRSGSVLFKLLNLLVVLFFAGVGVAALCPRFVIPSDSNAPALQTGDVVMAWPSQGFLASLPWIGPTLFPAPSSGALMIFKIGASELISIARVVAVPGDTVAMQNGVLMVNAKPVVSRPLGDFSVQAGQPALKQSEETLPNGASYITLNARDDFAFDTTAPATVPSGRYFVLNDNRDNAADSRDPQSGIGMVPAANMIGRVLLVPYTPAGKWPRLVR